MSRRRAPSMSWQRVFSEADSLSRAIIQDIDGAACGSPGAGVSRDLHLHHNAGAAKMIVAWRPASFEILCRGGRRYLHHSRRPLEEANLDDADLPLFGGLFSHECEGMCGV